MEVNPSEGLRIVLGLAESGFLPSISDSRWSLKGGGNFDGVGSTDWLWRHEVTGQDLIWLMGEPEEATGVPQIIESLPLPNVSDPSWKFKDITDLDDDGISELLWYQVGTNQEVAWYIDQSGVYKRTFISQLPTVNAGVDFATTTSLSESTRIVGEVSDSGHEPLTVTWSQVSGPGEAVFEDPASVETSVRFSQSGIYELKLTADDGISPSQEDTVVITFNELVLNRSPMVNAGADFSITLLNATATPIQGKVTDPDSDALTLSWSKLSGPGDVVFDDPTSEETSVLFSAAGVYELTLTANDGISPEQQDTVVITVQDLLTNRSPSVDAGADFSTTVFNWISTPLQGQATDPDADPLSFSWHRLTGPGEVVFEDSSAAETTVKFSEPGVYELQLVADDGGIASSQEDTVTVTVHRPTATRILPLGDSITDGFEDLDSYRKPLWQDLQSAGYGNVDFVGSETHRFTDATLYENPSFDLDHEGHGGWRVNDILYGYGHDRDGNEPYLPYLQAKGHLAQWVAVSQPDVALVHLGTNDVLYTESAASTIQEMEQLIDVLRAQNPNMAIFIAQIVPDGRFEAATVAFNDLVPDLVARKTRPDSPVIVVDHWTDYNLATEHGADGIHPNALGEIKMADRWFLGLEALFESGHTLA